MIRIDLIFFFNRLKGIFLQEKKIKMSTLTIYKNV
jgi:hypothetical protein